MAGKTALIFLAGEYSHAVGKGAMVPAGHVHPVEAGEELFVAEQIAPREPSPAELAVASAALQTTIGILDADLLYARIDLLPAAQGPLVGEVELIEPSLYLQFADGAADRFAAAIARRVGR